MSELQITIRRGMGRAWTVVAERSAEGVALPLRVESRFEIDRDQFRLIPDPFSYGMALGRALFRDPLVRDCRVGALGGMTLHVLLFVEAEDLRDLRWDWSSRISR